MDRVAYDAILKALEDQRDHHDRQHDELRQWLGHLDESVMALTRERDERTGAAKARRPWTLAAFTVGTGSVVAWLTDWFRGFGK